MGRLCDGKVGNDILDGLRKVGEVLVGDVTGRDNGLQVGESAVEASGVWYESARQTWKG